MSFFNKKSDVISVELTQYGKHLLSMGKFKPVYYDFFDNDILYDGQYGGILEERNNIQERIKNETPYSKPQYLFYGVQTKLKEQLKIKRQLEDVARTEGRKLNEAISFQQPEDKIYFTASPLGTTNLDDKLPTFNVYFYGSQILSSSLQKTLNNTLLRIPQINLKNNFYEMVSEPAPSEYELPSNYEIGRNYAENSEIVFNDGNIVKVNKQDILFEIEELNVKQIGDNFEIQLYEITSSNDGKETYKQLYFSENTSDSSEVIEDVNLVEYYFSIKIDEELDVDSLKKMRESPQFPRVYQPIKK